MKIIFDYNRTLYDPETDALSHGALELLKYSSKGNELFLISRAEPGRSERLERSKIRKYFKRLAFVDVKTPELFLELSDEDKDAIVIGDRVREEIRIGNRLGMKTIWVRQGKFADEMPEGCDDKPTFIVTDLGEVREIISNL